MSDEKAPEAPKRTFIFAPGTAGRPSAQEAEAQARESVANTLVNAQLDALKLCPGCGRMFKPYRSYQRYCSDYCRIKITEKQPSRYVKRDTVEAICKNCNKPFKTNDSKKHYCSKECYHEFQLKRHAEPEERHCFNCGKPFSTTHFIKRYCSDGCRREARNK